jgi:tetratricopeptide (TPR) repeat protein
LAWIAFLKGELTKSSALTAKARTSGFSYHERDKQAQGEAAAAIANPVLLKARLLFDGGYLNKALALLLAKAVDEFDSVKDQTEYYYRLGRIYDDLGKDELAIMNYQNTIATGKNLKYYFAARAALLSGKLYEKKKNTPKAKQNFNIAINMKGHEYENSIEAEAKLGLKRLGG